MTTELTVAMSENMRLKTKRWRTLGNNVSQLKNITRLHLSSDSPLRKSLVKKTFFKSINRITFLLLFKQCLSIILHKYYIFIR